MERFGLVVSVRRGNSARQFRDGKLHQGDLADGRHCPRALRRREHRGRHGK